MKGERKNLIKIGTGFRYSVSLGTSFRDEQFGAPHEP